MKKTRQTQTVPTVIPMEGRGSFFARNSGLYMAPLIQEDAHHSRPVRMFEFPERLGLNLPDAFAGHEEPLTNFFEGVVRVHADPEAPA